MSQSPVAVGPPRNPLLLPQIGDPLLAQVLERPSRGLAEATRPNFVQNPRSPVQWTRADFDKMEDSREPLLEWPSVLSQLNAEALKRAARGDADAAHHLRRLVRRDPESEQGQRAKETLEAAGLL